MTSLVKCFLDAAFADDNTELGRIVVELRNDVVPKTADNFLKLCTGENQYGLTYQGTLFNRIIPEFMVQCGKISDNPSRQSIYGERFRDENFNLLHTGPGILSMANRGPDTNGTSFFITTVQCEWLDNKHVVFGKVIEGMDIVKRIESFGTRDGIPQREIKVANCGQL